MSLQSAIDEIDKKWKRPSKRHPKVNDYAVLRRSEITIVRTEIFRAGSLLQEAVQTDGGHHKQWYLEEIAKILGIILPEHDEGIAP